MEKFIVSARKYRPQNFSTVVGQSHITTTLKNAIANNQLAHAFLFCGPRGVGKTTCARILAKTINCENRTADGEACNVCQSCVSFDNGTSLNIHELDAASNNSVDDIRTLVDQVRFAPQAGDYKVYIVDEVHMLSASAFNAFLKTLEEPPPFAIFILATTEKHKILPTILSRCQIFDFKRITVNDTVEHLREICDKENISAENAALHVIALKSEGCMRDALSILDKIVSFTGGELDYANTLEHLNILDEDYYFRLLEFTTTQQLTEALLLFDDINQKGFEGDTLLEGFTEFIRNLLVSRDAKAAVLLEVAEDFRAKYLQAASALPANWMIGALNVLNEAAAGYKQARNKRLCVEMALIKLCYLGQAMELIAGQDNALSKKKLIETAKPVAFKALRIIAVKEAQSPQVAIEEISTEPHTIRRPAGPAFETAGTPLPAPEPPRTKGFGNLNKIRARLLEETRSEQPATPLTAAALEDAWRQYTTKLETEKKHSSAAHFKAAVLRADDDNNFTVILDSDIRQTFIDKERSGLSDFLQQHFSNRQLQYSIEITKSDSTQKQGETLSAKQQYVLLAEKYPLLRELKERLKLELDY